MGFTNAQAVFRATTVANLEHVDKTRESKTHEHISNDHCGNCVEGADKLQCLCRELDRLGQDIETKMVALISVAGPRSGSSTAKSTSAEKEAYGHLGHEDDVVHAQEEVDDLLSSLGF